MNASVDGILYDSRAQIKRERWKGVEIRGGMPYA